MSGFLKIIMFLRYFKSYYQDTFNKKYCCLILVLLSIVIYLRYALHVEFKYVIYFAAFIIPFVLQAIFYPAPYLKCMRFWAMLFIAPLCFSIKLLTKQITGGYFYPACVFILLTFIFSGYKFYGLKRANLKPYLYLLLLMAPIIFIVSKQPSFILAYPKFKFSTGNPFLFEAGYSLDFVSIELFFRGFLILSFAKFCGKQCIIPIACFYCAIHLHKPAMECISSFFGGIFLGVITYETKSIRGGLIVHLGIAWMMEIFSLFI